MAIRAPFSDQKVGLEPVIWLESFVRRVEYCVRTAEADTLFHHHPRGGANERFLAAAAHLLP